MISITIKPIQHDKAVGQMNRYTTLVQAAASKSFKMANRSAISEQVLLALTRQETKLFSFRVVAMIMVKDIKTLKITSKSFRRQTNAMPNQFRVMRNLQLWPLPTALHDMMNPQTNPKTFWVNALSLRL